MSGPNENFGLSSAYEGLNPPIPHYLIAAKPVKL